MEINDIKIFNEVAKLNSTSKAADKLGYVQSNISKRIAKLESELEKKLFIRTNKGMVLTNDGEIFLSYAEEILSIISNMQETFSTNKKKITIGATQTISKNYLRKYYLREDILLFTRTVNDLVMLLKEDSVDFVIINKKLDNIEFKEVIHVSESLYWTRSKESKIDFKENKIIVSRDKECPYRIETLKYLERNNLEFMPVIEVDTLDILISMIETNKAIAILPEKTIELHNKLEKIKYIDSSEIEIYVYTLLNNSSNFDIELC